MISAELTRFRISTKHAKRKDWCNPAQREPPVDLRHAEAAVAGHRLRARAEGTLDAPNERKEGVVFLTGRRDDDVRQHPAGEAVDGDEVEAANPELADHVLA